ncbi:hypothetical protein KFE98_02740 [bacterium SCSIO 12741]|nr:hypothetical protein KFE98_02740 [bacterium SCSIO 12741]
MTESIVLKKSPKIEFQLLDNGFHLHDEQTEQNSGFYAYDDLQFVQLDHTWFPVLAKWMRIVTWILNGVPMFPDGESYKKAKVIIHLRRTKLGMWLTDTHMANSAKALKKILDQRRGKSN